MPTYYGPVDLKVRLTGGGRTLAVSYASRFRKAPERVVLHIPPIPGLKSVTLNGKTLKWDGKATQIVIAP